ncbi:hypothetical protein RWV98_03000 [Agathobaculum sp. NTUH-O15-33]|uniref:hypothetical protein n=1 Tax=Agathobaculum sp. NTUH-O15-33 TaxID=3079302 RepID=UPI0029587DE8|nr:hypothetical protein [Agathobaculum sp. NTUH-O15-33]WNX85260.1 hypothetical protein RWV98_03000 [Agathobaculum sp. NTUH-O15-33]
MDIKTAVVTGVEETKVKVRFSADEQASSLSYSVLASCTPRIGDMALMLRTSTSYICIGTVKK